MKKYQVIGGQYESCWIGESDSLHGAKILATRNMSIGTTGRAGTSPASTAPRTWRS